MINIKLIIVAVGLYLIVKGCSHKDTGLFDIDGALLIIAGFLVWLGLGLFMLGQYFGGF